MAETGVDVFHPVQKRQYGIVSGTPFESIEAFLDESVRYGAEHRARFQGR